MRIQDLQYYLALADLGSFSKVSKQFNVSQPTISLAMQRLEKELATELIWRDPGHQKFALTHPGRILQQHAQQIVTQYQLAEEEIQKEAEQKLLLVLSELANLAYFPAVEEHLSDHFFTHLQKKTASTNEALQALASGQADAALLTSPVTIEEKFTAIDIPHSPLQLSADKALPAFPLTFVYRKERLQNTDLSRILDELRAGIDSAAAVDFTLISKSH
ncbi:LysR family transcriptional regulator [Fructobacillus sp. M158]|uniref:LysR family transcriptional regulator n=1 Tax=Fructobacillus parabroussonetiae TaxID=2713174 RepID=UPI00200A6DB6|nr:LysR family transcriptional regulator [Fructobacillus parabroussonetiae]MCK8617878.1 LysR family transcriptional regulator [Fructobacillus parabroussonetiae]